MGRMIFSNGTIWFQKAAKHIKHNPLNAAIMFISIVGIVAIIVMIIIGQRSSDWVLVFRPAAREILSWRSPYNIDGFYNPPWALFPLLPLALLPAPFGTLIISLTALAIYYTAARRFGASTQVMLVLLLSVPIFSDLVYVNINWLVMLGVFLPPQIGLFFVLTKPQIGVAIAIYWLIETWRDKGFMQVLHVFAPVTMAFAASLLIYGLWPLRSSGMIDHPWNMSLWPGSIPLGLAFLVYAIRKRDIRFALVAAPMFSPYVLATGWLFPLIALSAFSYETIATVLGLGLWLMIQY
jgi:hypothetical protein